VDQHPTARRNAFGKAASCSMLTAILDVHNRYATRMKASFSVPKMTMYKSRRLSDPYVVMQSRYEVLIDETAHGLDATDALRPLRYAVIKSFSVNTYTAG